jgi:hypothetical protein
MNSDEPASRCKAMTEWQRFDTSIILQVSRERSNSFASGWLEIGGMFNSKQGFDLGFAFYDLRLTRVGRKVASNIYRARHKAAGGLPQSKSLRDQPTLDGSRTGKS